MRQVQLRWRKNGGEVEQGREGGLTITGKEDGRREENVGEEREKKKNEGSQTVAAR